MSQPCLRETSQTSHRTILTWQGGFAKENIEMAFSGWEINWHTPASVVYMQGENIKGGSCRHQSSVTDWQISVDMVSRQIMSYTKQEIDPTYQLWHWKEEDIHFCVKCKLIPDDQRMQDVDFQHMYYNEGRRHLESPSEIVLDILMILNGWGYSMAGLHTALPSD